MKNIEEITNVLFSVDYEKDFEDDEVYYKYEDIANDLINNNNWNSVYECWYNYLMEKCKDEDSILNYANLFWCYDGQKHNVYNAVEFVAYFYANIDFKKHSEADYLIDGIANELFLNSGIKTQEELYDYIPTNDPLVIDAIKKWKDKK